jgi:hypothetical protein
MTARHKRTRTQAWMYAKSLTKGRAEQQLIVSGYIAGHNDGWISGIVKASDSKKPE